MGDVLPFKRCRWSGNGLCLATSVFACVCHRDSKGRALTTRPGPVPPLLALGRDAGSIGDIDYSDLPKECPPPYELPQDASTDLIAFAKAGEPKTIEIIELDSNDVGC
jgi:hypothetical protein